MPDITTGRQIELLRDKHANPIGVIQNELCGIALGWDPDDATLRTINSTAENTVNLAANTLYRVVAWEATAITGNLRLHFTVADGGLSVDVDNHPLLPVSNISMSSANGRPFYFKTGSGSSWQLKVKADTITGGSFKFAVDKMQ